MKTIALTKGMVSMVDDSDFEFLNQWKWQASLCGGYYYAKRDEMVDGVKRKVYMHRLVSGAVPGQLIDHINRLTLDNQRINLRKGTQSQNQANRVVRRDSASGIKGVDFFSSRGKWRARIRKDRVVHYLGYFDTPEEAAVAYNNAAVEKFGEFALLNERHIPGQGVRG